MPLVNKKIGLYFGSFNPVHTGHLIIASQLLENSDLDQIWFVVSPQNPLKKKKSLLNNHHRLMLAIEKQVHENWVRLYIQRWLNMPVLVKSGELVKKQGKGTPQGGVISPLLASLFLHYVLDKWLEITDKTVKFARYADDAILHCHSKVHANREAVSWIRLCN